MRCACGAEALGRMRIIEPFVGPWRYLFCRRGKPQHSTPPELTDRKE